MLGGGDVPESHGATGAPADHAIPLRRPRDREHGVLVPLELCEWLGGGDIPESHGAIVAPADHAIPLRRPRDREHGVLVPLER